MGELFPTRCMVSPNEVKSKGCEQVTVLLAVIIIYFNKC